MNWDEGHILRVLAAILCVGSFGLFVLSYFMKRIKELWDEFKK
jgi:hypothetical protein